MEVLAKLFLNNVTEMDKYSLDKHNASDAKLVQLVHLLVLQTHVLDQDQSVNATNNTMSKQTSARTAQPINSQLPIHLVTNLDKPLMVDVQLSPKLAKPMDKYNLDNNNASDVKPVK
jgi:hypothetical protein